MKPSQLSQERILASIEKALSLASFLGASLDMREGQAIEDVGQAQDYEFADPLPTVDAFESFDHEIKLIPEYFTPLATGAMPFDLQYTNRDYKVGDTVLFLEWNDSNEIYSGQLVQGRISYILLLARFIEGLDLKWIVLGLSDVNPTWR